MGKKIIAGIAIVLNVAFAVSSIAFVSSAEFFLFRKDLAFTIIDQFENGSTEFVYYANTTDSGKAIADLYVRVESEYNNQRRVRVDVQHKGNTELDAVLLKFQSSDIASVYFQGYPYTAYSILRTPQFFTATVEYDRALGSIEASTPLEFIVQTTGNSFDDFNAYLEVDLLMHYKQPLELTQLKATADMNINLHQD